VGALITLVLTQLSVPGLYLPPVSRRLIPAEPPQAIISLPVHTAGESRALLERSSALVAVQLFVAGLYFPGIEISGDIIKSAPDDHLSTDPYRGVAIPASGTLVVAVVVQLLLPDRICRRY
jgi:hypothetical protein